MKDSGTLNTITVVATLISGFAVGVAFTARTAQLNGWLRLRRVLRLRPLEAVEIVVTSTEAPRARPGAAREEQLQISLETVVALAAASRGVGSLLQGKRVRVNTSETASARGDLIVIGGTAESRLAKRFVRLVRYNHPDIRFDFDDVDEHVNRIDLKGLPDGSWLYEWDRLAERSKPAYDFGVVIMWRNPFATSERRGLFVAGFTGSGTKRLSEYLFDRRTVRRLLPPVTASWRRSNFLAVYHILHTT